MSGTLTPARLHEAGGDDFCYLTTTGRVTGKAHTIEIWFAVDGDAAETRTLYLIAGGGRGSDWVRNLEHDPRSQVRVRDDAAAVTARLEFDGDEDERGRRVVFEKYAPRYGGDLAGWRDRGLLVALDLLA